MNDLRLRAGGILWRSMTALLPAGTIAASATHDITSPATERARRARLLIYEYVLTFVLFLVAAGVASITWRYLGPAISTLFLGAIVIASLYFGRGSALQRSQEQFALLVNGVTDQAFFMLDRHATVASWNHGAQRLLGYDATEASALRLTHIWPEWGRVEQQNAPAGRSLSSDRYEYQDWILRQDGSRFWGSIVLTALHDPAGNPRGYAVALRDISERKGLERDILEISERERERIGRDLHDGLGQELTGIALLSTALSEQLAAAGTDGATDAELIADLVHEAIRHTRELVHGLSPMDVQDDGLASSLRQLAERVSRVADLRCTFETRGGIRVDSRVAAHLYRITQEAINNAVRHAQAQLITIRFIAEAGRLALSITDDGVGFPTVRTGSGMGLRVMSSRAKTIRASLEVGSRTPHGTAVNVTLTRPEMTIHG